MNAPEFVSLSTTIIKDLQQWVSEAARDRVLSEIDLALVQRTVTVIERVTTTEADQKSDSAKLVAGH